MTRWLLLALLVATPALAQQTRLGGEAELVFPVGNYKNGPGLGLDVTGEWFALPAQPMLSFTGRAGVQLHLNKSVEGGDVHAHVLEFVPGARYYLMSSVTRGLWVQGELPVSVLFASSSATGGGSASETDLKLGLDARVGYQLDALDVFAGLGTQAIDHFGDALVLSVGAGYRF